MSFVWVTAVRYAGDYRLWLEFNDGLAGEVDLEDRLFGRVFEPLRDRAMFEAVRLAPEIDTICWPNGADFAPEFLHARLAASAAEVAEPPVPRYPDETSPRRP